ncbi:Transposon Ty3-I Gag-Pol polyprotein [Vespula squamosa]|uniref:Transposon Ty3-I Gag-Pol polyprotein n=1 Tax=Vespula squamosa TaxID=30214 RepID=A0ABD2BAA6_VESSQ
MKQDKNAGFTPKYLLEGEDITILPKELKQEKTQSDLKKDRKLSLHETIQSHTAHRKAESKKFHLTKLPPAPVTPTEEP